MSISGKDIQIYALGVGDSFTTLFNYTNFMIKAGDRRIHIDCPPYLLKMLRQYRDKYLDPSFRIENYRELILTHAHEDHCAGVEELGYMSIRNRPPRPKIYAPAGVHRELWSESLAAGLRWRMDGERFITKAYEDYFTPVTIDYAGPFALGDGLTLEIKKVMHMPETFALKMNFGPGMSFGYSSDTGFMPELFEWWEDCALIIHEVNFNPDVKWHTPLAALLTLPEPVQKKIRLCHYSDNYLEQDIGKMNYLIQGEIYQPFV